MANKVIEQQKTREGLEEGVRKLKVAVVTTIGPRGQNVAIEQQYGPAKVVHDGVTVAESILLENALENIGAQLAKEAALNTNKAAGDGTTTSTLLTYEIVHLANKYINNGSNAMLLQEGLEKALEVVLKKIKRLSVDVQKKDIQKVANISAQNEKIGKLIAEAFKKVGRDGVVTAEKTQQRELSVEYKEGMEYETGYISGYFSTNADRMICELENPYVLITDKKLVSIEDVTPLLSLMMKANRHFIIIAQDIVGEALSTLVVNRLAQKITPLAIKHPSIDKEVLEDIAIFTGATVISEETGRKLQSIKIEDLGQAHSIFADEGTTRIIGGKGDKSSITARIQLIKDNITKAQTDFEREKLKSRYSKLTGKAAVIYVGALTDTEANDKRERIIDAISSTKSALEEGVVIGGGTTLLKARKAIVKLFATLDDQDCRFGAKILYDALAEPIKALAATANEKPDIVLSNVENSYKKNYGFDVKARKYGDLLEMGVIDSTKVVRSAVENGVSAASMILTTGAAVQHIWEKETNKND
jgi:chaperonin GroEL